MKAMTPDGRATAAERRPQLRDVDILMDRDLLILERMYGGQRVRDISRLLKITPSMTYRRIREIPESVKVAMRRLVREDETRRDGGGLQQADLDRVRRAYKKYSRERSRAESLGRLQSA